MTGPEGRGWGLNHQGRGLAALPRGRMRRRNSIVGSTGMLALRPRGRGQETQKSQAVQLWVLRSAAQGISKAELAPSFLAASLAPGSPGHLHTPASLRTVLRVKTSQDHASTLRIPSCPSHCCFKNSRISGLC